MRKESFEKTKFKVLMKTVNSREHKVGIARSRKLECYGE